MSSKNHYYSIDILRGLTAFLICLNHFTNHSDVNGYLFNEGSVVRNMSTHISDVVFVFFLISGFVIPLSMAKQNFKINKLFPYLSRRLIRLEIPYIASMLLVLAITFTWSVKEGTNFHLNYWQIFHHFTYTTAIFNYPWLNEIYWTLAIEIQFYIVIALLYPFIISKNKFIQYTTLILFGISGLLFSDNRFNSNMRQFSPLEFYSIYLNLMKIQSA